MLRLHSVFPALTGLLLLGSLTLGCQRDESSETTRSKNDEASQPAVDSTAAANPQESASVSQPVVYEVGAQELLAARLPEPEVSEGWIRLFDGHTLFGWEIAGEANWRIEDGAIVVDQGEQGLLCTSMPWQDYELQLEYRAEPETNSGIFLRTPLKPDDPATDCYEVNIAPPENPYPTGGVVKRMRASEAIAAPDGKQWQTMTIVLKAGELTVSVGGKVVTEMTDPMPLPAGRIGLQHNSGPIAFRNIRLRSLGWKELLDNDLSQWKRYPEMPGSFTATDEGYLHVQGGRTQLESSEAFDDFVLLAEYKLPTAEMNSGIFFRCIPGDEMMGYECQISNEMVDGNPLMPADHGSGGIFRRQPARIVAGEPDQWATVVLNVHGRKIAAWVNGVQVSDWYDDREANENPRRGLRTEAGTLMIQGHDPGTDALFKQIKISSYRDS